ncbi:MAG TPA: site-specific integrase [Dongiaceae bacterium]|nr:site-specific integrase [Dongiaceae bacterium]
MATIRQKGPYQWHAQIRRNGYPNQTKTFSTRKEAEAWAREIEGKMDRGAFALRVMDERTTLGDLLVRYEMDVTAKRPGPGSKATEKARIRRFLREEPGLCAYAAINLTAELFEDYRDRRLNQFASRGTPGGRGQYKAGQGPKLRKDGKPRKNAARPKAGPKEKKLIAPGTVKRELTLLKRVIDRYKRKLGLADNPVSCENVERPAVNDERDVRLEAEKIKLLLQECYRTESPWLGPIVECAFEIGARRGSLLRLQWPDVDLEKKSVKLKAVKNSRSPEIVKDDVVGLSPRAIEILKTLQRIEGDLRVFPITQDALKCGFERARKRAGVEHFRFHDTRHERASSLVEAGWSDTQVMAQTGHKDPKSLLRYVNLRKETLGKALQELEDFRKLRSDPVAEENYLASLDPRFIPILLENAKLKAALKSSDESEGE